MSERKTTEIKLRVTPDEKARWQTEAERQGIALSELIRQTLNVLPQSQIRRRLAETTAEVEEVLEAAPACSPFSHSRIVANPFTPLVYAPEDQAPETLPVETPVLRPSVASPQEDVQPSVGTSDEVGSIEPWMYEARVDD